LETLKVTREIPGIVIVLSRDPLPGSTQQNKKSLEIFLNSASPQPKPLKTRKTFGQRNQNPADSSYHHNKKSKDGDFKLKEN
jgi:hypothetical protein